jgi:RNA polymerase sigma-70 factor, ECF subfamily
MHTNDDTPETRDLLTRAGAGDARAVGDLFGRHRDRLRRMVQLRIDRRLQGRLDPSDVLQEAFLEFSRALAGYLRNPSMPLYLWLRCLTGRKLQALHRRHLGTRMRAAGREIPLGLATLPQATSESLAAQLLGGLTTPSEAALRAELRARMQDTLGGMEPLDREVLALRHFEQLSNAEVARVLGISEAAASNRYARALRRLKKVLTDAAGGAGDAARPMGDPPPTYPRSHSGAPPRAC